MFYIVLLLGETEKSCEGVKLFLEQNRINYKIVTERTFESSYKKDIYLQKSNYASIVFCSFRNVFGSDFSFLTSTREIWYFFPINLNSFIMF